MTVKDQFGTDILLAGWSHSAFGKLQADLEELIVEVSREAIARANLDLGDIDAIFLGQFNSGLVPLSFVSSLTLQASDLLFGVPAAHVENACASGSAAFQHGVTALLAGTTHRREEPPQRRGQPLRSHPPGPRRSLLPVRLTEEPARGGPLAPH
jgi:acetyl-CoA C-acetyltransferase